jgi:hypothetical protein
MAYEYAILWEHEADRALPAVVVLQRDDHVLVEAPEEFCIPARYDEPFVVGSLDGPYTVTYTPSDPQYFDHVLIDLSRTFSMGERGSVPTASGTTVLRLLRDKVFSLRRKLAPVPYVSHEQGARYSAVKDYRQRCYLDSPFTHEEREPPAMAGAAEGSLVAA